MAALSSAEPLTITLELTTVRSKGRVYSLLVRADETPLIEANDLWPSPGRVANSAAIAALQKDIDLFGKLLADGLRRAFELRAGPPTALRIHIALPGADPAPDPRHWLPWERLPELPEVAEVISAAGIDPRLVPVIRLANYRGREDPDAPREGPGIVRVVLGVAADGDAARTEAERLREEIAERSAGAASGVFQLGGALPEVIQAGCDSVLYTSMGSLQPRGADQKIRLAALGGAEDIDLDAPHIELPGDPLGERRWVTLDMLQSALQSSPRPPRLLSLRFVDVADSARALLWELAAGLANLVPAVLVNLGDHDDAPALLRLLADPAIDLSRLMVDLRRSATTGEQPDRPVLYAAQPAAPLSIPPVPQEVLAALQGQLSGGGSPDRQTDPYESAARLAKGGGVEPPRSTDPYETRPAESTDPYETPPEPTHPYAERGAPPADPRPDPDAAPIDVAQSTADAPRVSAAAEPDEARRQQAADERRARAAAPPEDSRQTTTSPPEPDDLTPDTPEAGLPASPSAKESPDLPSTVATEIAAAERRAAEVRGQASAATAPGESTATGVEASQAGRPALADLTGQPLPAPQPSSGEPQLPLPQPSPLQVIVQPAIERLMQRYVEPACRLRVEVSQPTVKLVYYDEYNGQPQPPQHFSSPNRLDPEALLALTNQPIAYGRALFAGVFHDTPSAGQDADRATIFGFREAYRHGGADLRVELALDPNSPALHAIRWEYLCPPLPPGAAEEVEASRPLAVRERAPLYRLNDDPVQNLKLEATLKAVVAICAPSDLGQPGNALLGSLAVVDSAQERAIITSEEALGRLVRENMAEQVLLDRSLDGKAVTLSRLRREAAEASVLHLICHGVYWLDQFYLVLEREDGRAQLVRPAEFVQALSDRWPALILLGTCQSASARYGDALSGLGARLSQAGAPAVIAMQDLLPIKTAQIFNQYFYDHLGRSGRADMALAATRLDLLLSPLVADQGVDWSIPVLMMRAGAGAVYHADADHARHLGELRPHVRDYGELPGEGDPTGRIVRTALAGAGLAQLIPPGLFELLQAGKPANEELPLAQDRPALTAAIRAEVTIDPPQLQAYVEQTTPLKLPPTLYRQIAGALSAGKHVILIGPPGTGKTTLAQALGGYAASRQMCAGATLVTATADWTTFDTVGGYMPTAQGPLQFRPGRLLESLAHGHWLVIDEINRADADKAFGELFSVLAGQGADLPYNVAGRPVRIVPPRKAATVAGWLPDGPLAAYDYVRHPGWRVIGAMNVYDKAALFALSFALMRRFAFIDVDLPGHAITTRLLDGWLGAQRRREPLRTRIDWLLDLPASAETEPPELPNPLMARRALGPAIVKDLAEYIALNLGAAGPPADLTLLAEGLLLYVAPQLDGLDQEGIQAIYAFLARLLHPDSAARPAIEAGDLPLPTAEAAPVRRDEGGRSLLARIRQLYPHLPAGHWEG